MRLIQRTPYICVLFCWIWGGLFLPLQAHAAPAPAKTAETNKESKEYTLQDLLQLAWNKNPMIKAAKHQLDAMKARKQEAMWLSWWPQGTLVALLAPVPEARGDAVQSSTPIPGSYTRLDRYGLWTRLDFNMIWPLYTFGKMSLLQKAAGEGTRVGEANVRLEKAKLTILVQKAYYGLQLAESSLALLDEANDVMTDARKRTKAKTDQLKLAVIEAELQTRKLQATTGKRLAQSALARLTGLPLQPDLELEESELEETEYKVHPQKIYQELAQKHRPEVRLLSHAVKAKHALMQVQQRMWTPDFFIGGFFRFSYSNATDDQLNPFVRDDFNFLEGGLGLGLRFTIDVPVKMARARRAEAEFAAFRSRQRLADMGIRLDVERRYREFKAAQHLVEIQRKGRKAANQWLSRMMIGYSSGVVELKEVTDALLSTAKLRFGFLEALFQLHIAAAELSRSIGMDLASIPKTESTPTPRKNVAIRAK